MLIRVNSLELNFESESVSISSKETSALDALNRNLTWAIAGMKLSTDEGGTDATISHTYQRDSKRIVINGAASITSDLLNSLGVISTAQQREVVEGLLTSKLSSELEKMPHDERFVDFAKELSRMISHIMTPPPASPGLFSSRDGVEGAAASAASVAAPR